MLRPRTLPLRILCFGDSLTSGWSSAPDAPYAVTLETRLRTALPCTDVRVEADGIPGALARAFPRRMRRGEWAAPAHLANGLTPAAAQPWDWILVLGGTKCVPVP